MVDLYTIPLGTASGGQGYTRRHIVAATALLASANRVRVQFHASATSYTVTDAYIGLQAASGDPYDIDPATMVRLTKGGNTTLTIWTGNEYSDAVNLVVDGTRAVVVSLYGATNQVYLAGTLPAGYTAYHKVGNYAAAADESGFTATNTNVVGFRGLQGEMVFGNTVFAVLSQVWGDAPLIRSGLDQLWGLRLGADLVQRWSDAQLIKGTLSQPWGDAGVIIGQLVQRWRDMVALRARLDQPWAIMESLLVALEQPWALTSGPIRALLDQGWHVRDIEQVAAVLHQPWAIAADGAVLRYTVDVSADGQLVRVSHINIEADLGQDVLTAEIHPETEAEYLLCPFGAALQITVTSAAGTESFSFVVTSPRISEQHGDTRYIVEAMSPAVLLGEPYAAPVEGELSGRASVIAAALAGSIPLAWQTVDWAIPAAAWIASGETPLALLKQLAAAVGAVVQSRPDGSLVVQPAYPVSLPAWPAASPDLTLTETIDCFSTGSTPDHRPGYNRYLVSNQGSAADSLRLEESAISTTTKEVRGYQVPWDGFFDLTHTGGDWVVVEPLAIEERQETETVEFVAGAGRVRYPLYGVVAAEWQQTNLGTITTSEDGGLTSAIAGQSLLAITYTTRCRLWRVRDGQNEQLQLVAEVA